MFSQKNDPKQTPTGLITAIVSNAIRSRASDIHWEPYRDKSEEGTLVRFRVDGILRDIEKISGKTNQGLVVNAIKVMTTIDPTRKRISQDGRFDILIGEATYDIRVSIMPTITGEKIVMRITNKNAFCLPISELGMKGRQLELFKSLINKPEGFVLITGPAGSGKTTTLYSILANLYKREINICTIEDPVEVKFNGINQIQVDHEFGMTFVAGLRAIMRQDPNIIAVGEIRDVETVRTAFQASLVGSMVFSTLHAKDTINTITRLLDMGIEPFFISAALGGVVSQRLVRLLCVNCHGRGCIECHNMGFIKRIGIFEVLKMTERLRQMVLRRTTADELRAAAVEEGMFTFAESVAPLISQGVTTKDEVDSILTLD